MKNTNTLLHSARNLLAQRIPDDDSGIPVLLLIPLVSIALVALAFVSYGSNAQAAAERIHRDGYTDIAIASGRAHLCPESMQYGRDFSALNAKGTPVSGSICGTVANPHVLITVR